MTAQDFSIVFHIGVHKTATSHLQRSLLRSDEALIEAGVRYYGPRHFRLPGRSIQRLFQLKTGVSHSRTPKDQLELLRKGAHRLVMSEENYIGVLNSPRRREIKMRYPHAARRISELATAMDSGGLDIALAVRHPADFINSAYCQLLLGGRRMTFEQFVRINPVVSVNWSSLVKRLRRAKGVNRLIVWRYEDYGALFDRICAELVGAAAAKHVAPLRKRIHQGLSATAVNEVLTDNTKHGADKAAGVARRTFPVNEDFAPFNGFAPEERAYADVQYNDQIGAIKALPNVTFLEP